MSNDINEENIEDVVENLKYRSNKMTQILVSELKMRGLPDYRPSVSIVPGFAPISPEETQRKEKNTRNTLNARIVMLEKLSKELKSNPIFHGDEGKKNQKNAIAYLQLIATEPEGIWRAVEEMQKKYGIDMREQVAGILNSTEEINFSLKPETIEKIEKEDFDVSFDNQESIELMKNAVNVPVKTKIKNQFLKLKNKIFKSQPQMLLLGDGEIKKEGQISPRPKKIDREEYSKMIEGVWDARPVDDVYQHINDSTNKENKAKSSWWKVGEEEMKRIREGDKIIAQKYSQEKLRENDAGQLNSTKRENSTGQEWEQ